VGASTRTRSSCSVDTTNILFVCGGAFDGVEKVIRQRTSKTGIGFGAEVASPDDRKSTMALLREVEPEDLIKFGLIPSSSPPSGRRDAGRAGRGRTDPDPRRAEERPDQAVPEDVPDGGRRARGPGARAAGDRPQGACPEDRRARLRSILEQTLLDVMYDLPSLSNLSRCIVDERRSTTRQALLVFADVRRSRRVTPRDVYASVALPGPARSGTGHRRLGATDGAQCEKSRCAPAAIGDRPI